MKKLMLIAVVGLIGVSAFSSCRKDYECIDSDGDVISTCTNCRSNGVIKASFDSSCSLDGGTVVVK